MLNSTSVIESSLKYFVKIGSTSMTTEYKIKKLDQFIFPLLKNSFYYLLSQFDLFLLYFLSQ
jgi:hypothetical protein